MQTAHMMSCGSKKAAGSLPGAKTAEVEGNGELAFDPKADPPGFSDEMITSRSISRDGISTSSSASGKT